MKLCGTLLAIALCAGNCSTALGQQPRSGSARSGMAVNWRPANESIQRRVQRRSEYSHHHEASCQPSRGPLLASIVREAGPDAFRRPEVRATIAKLRRQMSREEKKEASRLNRIEANVRKYQEQLALQERRRIDRLALAQRPAGN